MSNFSTTLTKALLPLTLTLPAAAQKLVAYVPTDEVVTSGALNLSGSNSLLGAPSTITALPTHAARITLARGGNLLLCQSAIIHLTAAEAVPGARSTLDPLLIDLEAGGVELRMPLAPGDSLQTPEMHLASSSPAKPGLLDLALRITPNGDTCVENRDKHASAVTITDVFGHSAYQLKPGQHVLFQHGLLQEAIVADTTSCGCPPASAPGQALADALIQARPGSAPTFSPNADPFPYPTFTPGAPSGGAEPAASETPVQLAGTLVFDPHAPAISPTTPILTPPELDPDAPVASLARPAGAENRKKLPPPTSALMPPVIATTVPVEPLPGKSLPVKPAPATPPSAAAKAQAEPKDGQHHGGIGGFFRKLFGR